MRPHFFAGADLEKAAHPGGDSDVDAPSLISSAAEQVHAPVVLLFACKESGRDGLRLAAAVPTFIAGFNARSLSAEVPPKL